MPRRLLVTIDGPAGAGKSSVGKRLAHRLGYFYLDSGALYRAVALLSERQWSSGDQLEGLEDFLAHLELQITPSANGFRLWSQGQEITEAIRAPQIGQAASRVAVLSPVRHWVKTQLRCWAEQGGVVAEGRDLGTVVFPEAEVKIYLDASPEVRAERRWRELHAQGLTMSREQVYHEVVSRDERDRNRPEGPLRIPAGATVIDSGPHTLEEVVNICLNLVRSYLLHPNLGVESDRQTWHMESDPLG